VDDPPGIATLAYLVPLTCFGVVAYYGTVAGKLASR